MLANQILITRPEPTSETLAVPIRQLGYVPVMFPAMVIKDAPNVQILSQQSLDSYHKAVFISPVSVDKFAQYLSAFRLTCPQKLIFLAIGEDTACWIKKKICLTPANAILWPKHPPFNAEQLLALTALQQEQINHQAILLCQGLTGSEVIRQTLEKRGATVTALRLYQRCLPEKKASPNIETIRCIICTSIQALQNLLLLFGSRVKQKKFLVSSEKIRAYMQVAGFAHAPLLAKHAGDKAILAALKKLKSN